MKRKSYLTICVLVAAILVINSFLFTVAGSTVYRSPYDVAFSSDGSVVAVSDSTAGQVVFINPTNGTVTRSVTLNGTPKGLAWNGGTGTSARAFVAEYGAGTVAEVNPNDGSITRRFNVGLTPAGLAYVGSRSELLVTDRGLNKVYVINLTNGTVAATINVVYAPEAVDVKSDGNTAVVANLTPYGDARSNTHAAEVSFIDLSNNTVLSNLKLPQGSTSLKDIKVSKDGTKVFVTHTLGRVNVTTSQVTRGWMLTNALSILDMSTRTLYATVLLDGITEGAANPWGMVQSSDGSTLYINISGTHQVAKINLTSLWSNMPSDSGQRAALKNNLAFMRGKGLISFTQLPGMGPRGIDLSSSKLAVPSYFDGKVYLMNPSDMSVTYTVSVGTEPSDDSVRAGEREYNDASCTLQKWLSCISCHPESRPDGLNWDLMNDGVGNPKNSKSHLYAAYTPPSMATGIRLNAAVAINAGFLHIKFEQAEQTEQDNVLAYLQSLTPDPNPYLASGGYLTSAADAGKDLFNSPSVGCYTCHSGTYYTDMQMYNVGTEHTLDRIGTFDTPSLNELWRSAPYLHDGSAPTLRDVLTTFNTGNQHGTTTQLTSTQLDQLAAYLLQIGGTDPTP